MASHVDTFDPKPKLDEYHGKELPFTNPSTERKTGAAYRSPFKFQNCGDSGIPVSAGRDFWLTDVHSNVVHDITA